MAANVINYLYEDLLEGHVVLATEWNDAMSQIKTCLNNHAIAIDQKAGEPFLFDINRIQNNWQGPTNGLYYFTLLATIHNKGVRPVLRVFDQDWQQVYCSTAIDTDTGDITIYSNGPAYLHLEVR